MIEVKSLRHWIIYLILWIAALSLAVINNATGVQYFARSNSGTCVMVNADGTPYTGEDANG